MNRWTAQLCALKESVTGHVFCEISRSRRITSNPVSAAGSEEKKPYGAQIER
jgi:hypothetical protein